MHKDFCCSSVCSSELRRKLEQSYYSPLGEYISKWYGLKNYTQPKTWELCFIWWKFLGLKPRRKHLKWPWENCSKKVGGRREKPGYIEVLQQRAGSLKMKRLLLIKENQITQVKAVSSFLCNGRCKGLGSLKSLLPYAAQLSMASILCFHILNFLSSELTIGRDYSLKAARWKAFLSFPSSLRADQLTLEGCGHW